MPGAARRFPVMGARTAQNRAQIWSPAEQSPSSIQESCEVADPAVGSYQIGSSVDPFQI